MTKCCCNHSIWVKLRELLISNLVSDEFVDSVFIWHTKTYKWPVCKKFDSFLFVGPLSSREHWIRGIFRQHWPLPFNQSASLCDRRRWLLRAIHQLLPTSSSTLLPYYYPFSPDLHTTTPHELHFPCTAVHCAAFSTRNFILPSIRAHILTSSLPPPHLPAHCPTHATTPPPHSFNL